MATIKSFTDLSQSKTLSTILPLESADMTYSAITEGARGKMIIKDWEVKFGLDIAIKENLFSYRNGFMIPCWSLAALLNVLPYPILCKKSDNTWGVDLWVDNKFYCTYASDKIDACYEMIIKLHELNLL